jgi:DNA-binding transcriptional regulator YdaS (Cro superfamily)
MPKPAAKPSTPEGRAITAAIESGEHVKAVIAEQMGVSPGLVSQWASGKTKVTAKQAPKLAKMLGVEPQTISKEFREFAALQPAGTKAESCRDGDHRDYGPAVEGLERDVHALGLALGIMATVMVRHRPAEAAEAVAVMRRRVPVEFRETGVVQTLIELLEKAEK